MFLAATNLRIPASIGQHASRWIKSRRQRLPFNVCSASSRAQGPIRFPKLDVFFERNQLSIALWPSLGVVDRDEDLSNGWKLVFGMCWLVENHQCQKHTGD